MSVPTPAGERLPRFDQYGTDLGRTVGTETWKTRDLPHGRDLTIAVTYTASTIGPVATITQDALHNLLRLAGFRPQEVTTPADIRERVSGRDAVAREAARFENDPQRGELP